MDSKIWVFVALLIVLLLIGAAAWLVRKFSSGNVGAANRGRMPRLAVIDAAAVDGRRRLVLVRRDNVEHLIMIGGPTDVVVEPNIVRGAPQREQAPQRAPAGTELPGRIAPLPEAEWQDAGAFDHREPAMPEPPPRTARAPYPDETRRHSPPIADYEAGPSFTPEPIGRAEPRATPRAEPAMPRMPRATDIPAKPAAPRATRQSDALPSSADQNLADMAQRLEAALRRPGSELRLDGGETRAPSVNPGDRVGAPAAQARPAARTAAAPAAKPGFDNLEDEMASLLGRPKPPA
jgi:flagellar biogenesis protein FliO